MSGPMGFQLRAALWTVAVFLLCDSQAIAMCEKPAAPAAFSAFERDPAGWAQANKGKASVADGVKAFAASAVNSNDTAFSKALSTALGIFGADDGRAIGAALATLTKSCGNSQDGNQQDLLFIAQYIEPSIPSNEAANSEYGKNKGSRTASTGGGAGGSSSASDSGAGSGPVGNQQPSSGNNTTPIPNPTSAFATGPEVAVSVSSVGATGSTGADVGSGDIN